MGGKKHRSSWTTPTSIWLSTARSGEPSALPSALHGHQPHPAPRRNAAEFTARFVERAKKLRIGNGLDETVEVGPQVNPSQIETSVRYVKIALDEGAELLTGGTR